MQRKILMAAAALFAFAAGAEAQSVTGKWDVEYPTRVRQSNGQPSAVEQMGKAVLTIETQRGDSVFGTWQVMAVAEGAPKPEPRRIVGLLTGDKLTFVGAPVEAKLRRSGGGGGEDETSIMMRTYYEGTLSGSAIEGTMYSQSEDETIKSSPAKWTAKKAS